MPVLRTMVPGGWVTYVRPTYSRPGECAFLSGDPPRNRVNSRVNGVRPPSRGLSRPPLGTP